jgi:hypothetical protein
MEMEKIRNLICRHFHHLSWPRRDAQGCYQVCLTDARRLPWTDPMPLLSPYRKEHSQESCLLVFNNQQKLQVESTQQLLARQAI